MEQEAFVIRAAVIADYEAANTLMGQVQALHVGWRPDIYRMVEPFFSPQEYAAVLEQNTVLAAELDGQVCAMMILTERLINGPVQTPRRVLFIDSLAVEESRRGRGIGSRLLEKALQIAGKEGYDGLELQVNAKNQQARRLYERLGFTEKSVNLEIALP